MLSRKYFLVTVVSFSIMIFALSCSEGGGLTYPRLLTKVSMEVISYNDKAAEADSNLCYEKVFAEWSTVPDQKRADSLANWFARSKYKIREMWIPKTTLPCMNPLPTGNVVTLKLASPDAGLFSLGYKRTSYVMNPCIATYRHYIFVKNF